MNTKLHPKDLCEQLLKRSQCAVQVAAVLVDSYGVHSWGWNHSGADGMGEHAEIHTLKRANKARLSDSILFVAARRKKSGSIVTAKPCGECAKALKNVGMIRYRDRNGWFSA